MPWDSQRIAFVDIETQSTCDIEEAGGRIYANHPSTRLFIVCVSVDDVFHVWIPEYKQLAAHSVLWPNELKPAKEVVLYHGKEFPKAIYRAIHDADGEPIPLVAHNAYGFDKFIWNRFCDSRHEWLDTLYLARIAGRQGKLDLLSKALLGAGKDRAKKLLPILTTATNSIRGKVSYPVIPPGDLAAFTTYTIADVELLIRIWAEFNYLQVEQEIINVHNQINERGVCVDSDMLSLIEDVSNYSVAEAAKQIATLTRGRLNENNIRSVQQVHEWIESWGITIRDDNGKKCLRKDVVQRYINSPYIIEENLTSATEIPPIVIDVLRLRMKALRITDAKVSKAKARTIGDRIYDLHTYHVAHTGRASSQGVQVHNLPRPLQGLNIENIIKELKSDSYLSTRNDHKQCFDKIKSEMLRQRENAKDKAAFDLLTVDDVLSTLIRPCIKAKKGHKLALCDFSTVECRGVAWIANEEKLLEVFHRQDKGLSKFGPYEDFASRLYGIPIDQVNSFQRQVAKPSVLGCGYGMGTEKMRIYAAAMGVNLVAAGITAEQCISLYRDTYTKIAGWKPKKNGIESNFRVGGIWKTLEKAVKDCVHTRTPQSAGRCTFLMMGSDLVCVLPSGRHIHYPDAKIEDVVPAYCYTLNLPLTPKATVTFESTRGKKSLYGGLITENIVQAICRDLMYCAMVEMSNNGLNVVMHVHDEIVVEEKESYVNDALELMVKIMSKSPDWARGFPLASEGFVSERFVKKAFKGEYELSTASLLA